MFTENLTKKRVPRGHEARAGTYKDLSTSFELSNSSKTKICPLPSQSTKFIIFFNYYLNDPNTMQIFLS